MCIRDRLDPIGPEFFDKVAWLYFLLLPAAPLILESQGFYNRPVIYPRRLIIWPLFKGCLIITVGLVLAMFAFHIPSARGGMVFFGVFGFILVFLKEEIFRLALHSTMAKLQYKRRVILVGTDKEVARMRHDLDLSLIHISARDAPGRHLEDGGQKRQPADRARRLCLLVCGRGSLHGPA